MATVTSSGHWGERRGRGCLLYYCNNGEWRKKYLCPPTPSGSACPLSLKLNSKSPSEQSSSTERFLLLLNEHATDWALRLCESSREQRNEQRHQPRRKVPDCMTTLKICASGSCFNDLQRVWDKSKLLGT